MGSFAPFQTALWPRLVAASLVVISSSSQAQGSVFKCIEPGGRVVFQATPCANAARQEQKKVFDDTPSDADRMRAEEAADKDRSRIETSKRQAEDTDRQRDADQRVVAGARASEELRRRREECFQRKATALMETARIERRINAMPVNKQPLRYVTPTPVDCSDAALAPRQKKSSFGQH